ncbi:hypothetical protein [Stenotrophomonas sp. AB1(2024)]|uniref:hypothetical protein n=1 Tax=Stenotrophomonas sp. AB1(2024) TaxID=3132215 RepID=UPI0030AB23BE
MIPWYLSPKVWLLAALVSIAALLYWRGGSEAREEVRELTTDARATAKSNEISRSTQQRIETEGYETQRQAQERVARVQERIAASPDSSHLDADILRESREAWAAAIRSACRLRRTFDCPAADAAP